MITLTEFQKGVLTRTEEMFSANNRVATILPTGSGKSFIVLDYLQKHYGEKSLILAPSDVILEQFKHTADKYESNALDGDVTLLKYLDLGLDKYSEIKSVKFDNIIVDEFHRIGATTWEAYFDELMNSQDEKTRILGSTATPVRYLDNARDMGMEIFNGNYSAEYYLGDAIEMGIVNPPKYVSVLYSESDYVKDMQNRINNLDDELQRNSLNNEFQKQVVNADGIDKILKDNITVRDGRYVVFARNVQHIEELRPVLNKALRTINPDIHEYITLAERSDADKQIIDFENDDSDALKLIYSVDRFNEGLHLECISGEFMFRPTTSPIIYFQQLGRCVSADKENTPVVFDFVNNFRNISNFYSVNSDEELEQEFNGFTGEVKANGSIMDLKIFQGTKMLDSILTEIENTLSFYSSTDRAWEIHCDSLTHYYEENDNFPLFRKSALGMWLSNQRKMYKSGILEQWKIDRLLEISPDIFKSKNEIENERWIENVDKLERYYKENRKFPSTSTTLGKWLSHQREAQDKKTLENWRMDRLLAISPDIFKSQKENWLEKAGELEQYFRENRNLPSRREQLGNWWNEQIKKFNKGKLEQWKIDRLFEISPDILRSRKNIHCKDIWRKNADNLELYYKQNRNFPLFRESSLGIWLRTQKKNYNKGELADWKINRLLEISPDIFKSQEEMNNEHWIENTDNLELYYKENRKLPLSGSSLGRWLSHQKKLYKKGKLVQWKIDRLLEITPNIFDKHPSTTNEIENNEIEETEEWY